MTELVKLILQRDNPKKISEPLISTIYLEEGAPVRFIINDSIFEGFINSFSSTANMIMSRPVYQFNVSIMCEELGRRSI